MDSLHRKAGSRAVVELHGALADVRCLACGRVHARDDVHRALVDANRAFDAARTRVNPDGDVELRAEDAARFVVVPCPCGGDLKPDVVMFGENVRPEVLEAAWAFYERADALLVVGSSLHVYSGRRFLARAHRDRKPAFAINLGPVRDGHLLSGHIDGRAADVLPRLARALL